MGRWRMSVSPKECSLAYDEVKDQLTSENFEPELNLLVSTRIEKPANSFLQDCVTAVNEVIEIRGRITVSF
jgi:hypothetical protein